MKYLGASYDDVPASLKSGDCCVRRDSGPSFIIAMRGKSNVTPWKFTQTVTKADGVGPSACRTVYAGILAFKARRKTGRHACASGEDSPATARECKSVISRPGRSPPWKDMLPHMAEHATSY